MRPKFNDPYFEKLYTMIWNAQQKFEEKVKNMNIPAPLYEYGDWVKFRIKMFEDCAEHEYIGQIAIIDKYGTFEQNEEPSYDIYVKEMDCLFKHFRQSKVKFVKKGDGTCAIEEKLNENI